MPRGCTPRRSSAHRASPLGTGNQLHQAKRHMSTARIIYDDFGLSSILSFANVMTLHQNRPGHRRQRRSRREEERGKEGGGDVRRLTGLRRSRLFVWSATRRGAPLRPAHLASSSSLDACVLRCLPRQRRFLLVSNHRTAPFCPRR